MPGKVIFAAPSSNANIPNSFSMVSGQMVLPTLNLPGTGSHYASLTRLQTNGFQFQLDQLFRTTETGPTSSSFDFATRLLSVPDLEVVYPGDAFYPFNVTLQYIPNSFPVRLIVTEAQARQSTVAYSAGLGLEQGVLRILNREQFEHLAQPSSVPGALGVKEIKFVITDVDSDSPVLYLMNSKNYPLHYDFCRNILGLYFNLNYNQGLEEFNGAAYFSNNRQHLAGSLIAYDNYTNEDAPEGVYALEFWPTDPISPALTQLAYNTILQAAPFLDDKLFYHPTSETHESIYYGREAEFSNSGIHVILTDNLFAQTSSSVLNTGEAFGQLKVVSSGDPAPTEKDIAIYTFVPNTLSHVGGIITEAPQTPLSHINLKARQNDTPNAYIRDAANHPDIAPLIGQWVHYQVTEGGFQLQAASQAEVDAWLEAIRPKEERVPLSDLSITQPVRLTTIGFGDGLSFGVKAANVAELGKILVDGVAPDGYAIPFALYDEFMGLPRCGAEGRKLCDGNSTPGPSFYDQARTMLNEANFKSSTAIRADRLKAFRKTIKKSEVPSSMTQILEAIRLFWELDGPPFSQSLRVRSSTNNEDLEGFNGAGLYDSFTHKKDEGNLSNSIKQVWASLWTDRAFEERRFHRINHFKTYMGVLVHPNYGDEQVNGVAITKNVYNAGFTGLYVNAQYGEVSITNPEPIITEEDSIAPVPDEFLMSRLPLSGRGFEWEVQYIRRSNLETVYEEPVPTENVLTDAEIVELRDAMLTIQKHFKSLYQGDDNFAMDIEFKITETGDGSRGRLAIKQARPWVE